MGESALLLLRMIGSLAVVAVLLWALTKLARARGLGTAGQDFIDVRAQRGLSRNSSIILVQVGAKHLLLGVADGGIRVLSEGDELISSHPEGDGDVGVLSNRGPVVTSSKSASASLAGAAPLDGFLDRLRDRTVRKQQ